MVSTVYRVVRHAVWSILHNIFDDRLPQTPIHMHAQSDSPINLFFSFSRCVPLCASSSEAYELLEESNSSNTTSYDATRPGSAAAQAKPYVPLTGRRLLLFSVGVVSVYLVSGVVIYAVGSNMTVVDALYFSIGE